MKGRIYTTISSVVKNLGKQVKTLQPLYEAISNSLEANATEITVTFHKNASQLLLEDVSDDRVTGFSIMDNGDGFTEKNRKAFCELWTDNKISLGCKGSGRFTWLSVFRNILVESVIASEGKKISIPFSFDFEEEDIKIEQKSDISNNVTTITFTNITSNFNKQRIVDNLEELFESVREYLLVKLFLLKNDGKKFRITFCIDGTSKHLTNDNIPDLTSKTFIIQSDLFTPPKEYSFILYYHFFDDAQNSKKGYYCANNRAAQAMGSGELGFSASLPNRDSFRMLLCSDYFDDKDSDSRNGLIELLVNEDRNLVVPLLFSDIRPRTIREMQGIIKERYPEIEELNKKTIKEAIARMPYLASIIRENDEIVKSVDSLLKDACIKFAKKKEAVQSKFNNILKKQDVGNEELLNSVNEVSDVALAELGEYIQYRNSIIVALRKGIEDDSKKEVFFTI
ncbi:MAG: ATP-binding protein [Defluviitaleaceae bacterium]|nr:ATP-binding protein [Defluviitaleaceae bacterium]